MNRGQALEKARLIFTGSGIEEAFLEGEILLRHAIGIDRAGLFASLNEELASAGEEHFSQLVERRRLGEPSAYITGHREFYGLDFKVDPRVLIPRPDTELLVERAIDLCRRNKYNTIADIGTGSGCIAISLARHLNHAHIYAVDISPGALAVAIQNSIIHDVQEKITFLEGDLLAPLPGPVDIVVANLPYVKKTDLNLKSEPELALDGGIEGLDKINKLCRQAPGKINPGGRLLMEIGQGQAESVAAILHDVCPHGVVEVFKDLGGIDRVVSVRLTS
jgi:release factor glutamine methyltransferase